MGENGEEDVPDGKLSVSKPIRNGVKNWGMATGLMFGLMIAIGMRCNVGVAVVKVFSDNVTTGKAAFDWTVDDLTNVDESFFWGHILTQLLGGVLATFFLKPNLVFGVAILVTSLLNLLLPVASTLDPTAVIAVRVLQGLADGATIPACFATLSLWAPSSVRTTIATLAFSGVYFGMTIGQGLSGFLADTFSWNTPYYFYGCLGIVWFLFWGCFSSENPGSNTNTQQSARPALRTTPWLKVLLCLPLWPIIVTFFSNYFTYYIICMVPKYLKEMFSVNISTSSNLFSFVNVVGVSMILAGGLADILRSKKKLSTTLVRRVLNTVGVTGQVLCLLFLAFNKSSQAAYIALFCLAATNGVSQAGFQVNLLDIAPRYAGMLGGLCNGVGVFAGQLSPVVLSVLPSLVSDNPYSMEWYELSWQAVMILAAVLNTLAGVVYVFTARGEEQVWAVEPAPGTNNLTPTS